METAIGKAIDLVCEYSVVPLARQLKYAFCYKSFISDMERAGHELENDKKLVEQSVDEAGNNLKVISGKAKDWLQEVEEAHKEVRNLYNTYEHDQATRSSCIGQIINPIARHQLGRKATKKKQIIEELLLKKPKPEDISYEPQASGILNEATAAAAARRNDNGVFQSSCWNEAINKIMIALKDDTTNIIGLHGMGGVGKSTMLNEVHLQVLEQCMFDEVAKVEVKAEVDIMRIQEEIASVLGLRLEKHSAAIRAQLLSKRLLKKKNENDTAEKKKVLIILDDLWEKLELGHVGIPSSNDQVQIKLLLTSRDEHLLSDKMGVRNPIPLDVLSNADALRMFKRVVGLGDEDEDEGGKATKAAEIAPKCSGLPVVIMAIANALKDKVLKEWEDALQQLDVTDALSKLEVSYDYLPSEETKRLFLICGMIRGPRIQVKDLLKYTYGLGLYEEINDIHTLAAAASELENLLSCLVAASMLLKRDHDGRYVRIHDRMRDLAVAIVKRNRHEWAHFTLRDDRCDIPRRFDASRLELILSYCEESDSQLQQVVPDSFFKDLNKLYVLEFTNLKGGFSLGSSTGNLRKLETLCLHKCSLSDISMIGELKGLRILSCKGSDISKLPIQLGGLTALKMLDLSDCEKLTQIEPNVLGSLTKLEELNMENSFKDWEIDDAKTKPSNARLIELKNMSRLTNLRIHIPNISMLPKDDQLFSSKINLYHIMLGPEWNWQLYADKNEPRVLMLQLDDSPDVLQLDWVQSTLQRTKVLCLQGSLDGKLETIDEICVRGFESLKHLKVKDCPSIRYLVSSNSGSNFMSVESLILESLENLEMLCQGLPEGETTFNQLKVIKVEFCENLRYLFDLSLLKGCSSQVEKITVNFCDEIQCIVVDEDDMITKDVATFFKLRKLKLNDLPMFSSFCTPQSSQPSMKILIPEKKVAFPCLESLKINSLYELEYIWHPTDPLPEVGNLRTLYVEYCHNLVCVINSNVMMRLYINLETLSINNCGSIKHVFDLRYELLPGVGGFQLLKEMMISACLNMEAIVLMMMGEEEKEETHQQLDAAMQYSSLKNLNIQNCKNLKRFCWYKYSCGKSSENLVAASITTDQDSNIINTFEQLPGYLPFFSQKETFPCLETLNLYYLEELRQIWPHEEEVVEAQRSFYKLKQVRIEHCPKLLVVLPSTLIDCLEKLESIFVRQCVLMQSIIVNVKNINPTLMMDVGQHQEMIRFTFHSLRELDFSFLPNLDRFCSSSPTVDFPSLETLKICACPKVTTLFIQKPDASNGRVVGTALFGYCDKLQVKSFSNLKFLELWNLENFTEIWKTGSNEDGVALKMVLERLTLRLLPKLRWDIFIFDNKCTTFSNSSNILPPQNGYILFPSLQDLSVQECDVVRLFDSDSSTNQIQLVNASTTIEQFLILSKKAIPCHLRSLATSYENGFVELEIEEEHDMRFGQKQHLHLKLMHVKSSSCMDSLPLTSVSFCKVLTRLTVWNSTGLEYLLTPVGATSLVHLTCLDITGCDNLKGVVAEEDEVVDDEIGQGHLREIAFNHLKELSLSMLPLLNSFSYSGKSFNLNFPSLEKLIIASCPKMRIFSTGRLTTPKLHQVNWGRLDDEDQSQLLGDLNTTIQKKYAEQSSRD